MSYPTAQIRTLCRAVNVGHVGPSSMHRDPNGIPFLMGKDVGFGEVRTHNLERVAESFHRSQPKSQLCAGDVIVVRIGKSGQAAKVPEDLGAANCSGLVIIKQPLSIDADFLVYFLNSPLGRANSISQARGATRMTLNTESVASAFVPVPPISEQRRIVTVLDEAFESIATMKANAEKNLQNARELFTNQLERIFTEAAQSWRCVALEDIGTTQTGSTPKSSEPENLGDYLPFVKPGDFNRDGSITFDNEGLSEIGARKARRVKANSALMVCIGATIGKAGYTEREIATNQQVNAWTPAAEVSAKFIYYQMTTADFQRRVRQGAGQATLPIINKSKWRALTVVVPPTLGEQVKIVADLDALLAESMNLESVYGTKLAALEELKRSVLYQAFTGALWESGR